ncbi:MAG: hypothetical protein ACJ768_23005 [Gaiellaceae bacterium]
MRAALESRPRLRAVLPLALGILVIALIPSALWLSGIGDHRKTTHPKRGLAHIHQLNLKYERDYQYEAAFEKCGILRPADVARRLGVRNDVDTVARAYADRHAPEIRETVYLACRDAFRGKWAPPGGASPAPAPAR